MPISILFCIYFHLVQLQAIKCRWSKQFTESSSPSELMAKFITIEKLYDDVTCLLDNKQNTNQNSGNIFSEIGTFLCWLLCLYIFYLLFVIVRIVTSKLFTVILKYKEYGPYYIKYWLICYCCRRVVKLSIAMFFQQNIPRVQRFFFKKYGFRFR